MPVTGGNETMHKEIAWVKVKRQKNKKQKKSILYCAKNILWI